MSKKLSVASAIMTAMSAIMAVLLVSITPALAHHDPEHGQGGGEAASFDQTSDSSSNGSTDTKGNDRKSGYSDTSSTPQAPNHGKGADNDGDADADRNTGYTEDNDTNDGGTRNNVSDAGDNKHPSGKDRSVESGKSGTQGKAESNPDDSKGPMRYEGTQGDDKANGPGGGDVADQDGNNGCGNDDDFDDDNNGWCGKRVRPATTKPSDTTKPKTCPNGSAMPASGKCDENKGEIVTKPKTCPNGSAMPASGKCDEIKGEIVTKPKTCPNGSAMPASGKCDEILGDVITKPKTCPNGSAMPANGKCEEVRPVKPVNPREEVLGDVIERGQHEARPKRTEVLGVRLSPAPSRPATVAAAVLPFTGADLLIFLMVALALTVAGAVSIRSSRRNA